MSELFKNLALLGGSFFVAKTVFPGLFGGSSSASKADASSSYSPTYESSDYSDSDSGSDSDAGSESDSNPPWESKYYRISNLDTMLRDKYNLGGLQELLGTSVLDLSKLSNPEIKKMCKNKYKQVHPDRGGDDETFKAVREACTKLQEIVA